MAEEFLQFAQEEAKALVGLVETTGRKVFVAVVIVQQESAVLVRACSASTATDLAGFCDGLEVARAGLTQLIERNAQ